MQPLHRTGANRTVRDSAAVQAAGKTLLLPVEADHLLCLDTVNGRLIWSCPRGEMQAIVGITADKVILSGGQKLYAQNLQTGRPAWRDAAVDLPGKAQCGGRGFLAGKYFYLPTTWNEIIQFDVDAGRIVERFPMKTNLGNLTAVENLLISQTGESVQVFNARQ
jgi:outer membrane protein assembly factor BamB